MGAAVALAVAGVVPGALGAAAAAGTAPATQGFTIVRSSYGVPTITATSQARMWFGAGWAQAQDRMVQLELTRRTVEGTLSAIAGPGRPVRARPGVLPAEAVELRRDLADRGVHRGVVLAEIMALSRIRAGFGCRDRACRASR